MVMIVMMNIQEFTERKSILGSTRLRLLATLTLRLSSRSFQDLGNQQNFGQKSLLRRKIKNLQNQRVKLKILLIRRSRKIRRIVLNKLVKVVMKVAQMMQVMMVKKIQITKKVIMVIKIITKVRVVLKRRRKRKRRTKVVLLH